MDDLVKDAMRKWPNVPHCFGWLGLDGRGNWFLRDDKVQANGDFLVAKGDRLEHTALREFIERNYTHDDLGQWYFQNGPQRVYVELAHTPWIWRVHTLESGQGTDHGDSKDAISLKSHTGLEATFLQAFEDESGRLYLNTSLGFGIVHTQDMWHAANCLESVWPGLEKVDSAELPGRFKFVLSPSRGPRL